MKIKKCAFWIFIFLSIIFLGCSTVFFGYRLIHFYLLENGNLKVASSNLDKVLTSNVITEGDGLYLNNGHYFFYGKNVNNYILYSNRLFRIISIDKNGNIKLISDNIQTVINNGDKNIFLNNWLKSYYDTLNKEYIIPTEYCSDTFDTILSCDNKENVDITLLSIDDYIKAGNKDSYLNNNTFYYLNNINSNNEAWYINDEGTSSFLTNKASLGVRPVITIKSGIDIISGDGSQNNPYIVEDYNKSELKDAYIGSYVNFSDKLWRISKIQDSIILTLVDKMDKKKYSLNYNEFNINDKSSLAYYLNNDFLNELDKEKMVINNWHNGLYNDNYEDVYKSSINSYVGLNSIGDIFFNEDKIFTINSNGGATKTIYTNNISRLSIDDISSNCHFQPLISLSLDTKIELGSGTILNPYVVK